MIDVSETIIEKQRQSFRQFMDKHKLNANAWAKKAGIAEATIRHYLAGRNNSITSVNLERLAQAVGVTPGDILGRETVQAFDINNFKISEMLEISQSLFVQAYVDFERFKLGERFLNSQDRANALFSWYQLSNIMQKMDKNPYH